MCQFGQQIPQHWCLQKTFSVLVTSVPRLEQIETSAVQILESEKMLRDFSSWPICFPWHSWGRPFFRRSWSGSGAYKKTNRLEEAMERSLQRAQIEKPMMQWCITVYTMYTMYIMYIMCVCAHASVYLYVQYVVYYIHYTDICTWKMGSKPLPDKFTCNLKSTLPILSKQLKQVVLKE